MDAADFSVLLALSNDHAAALSGQEPAQFAALLEQACWTRTVGDAQALLIALDQDARYENPKFAGSPRGLHASSISTGWW